MDSRPPARRAGSSWKKPPTPDGVSRWPEVPLPVVWDEPGLVIAGIAPETVARWRRPDWRTPIRGVERVNGEGWLADDLVSTESCTGSADGRGCTGLYLAGGARMLLGWRTDRRTSDLDGLMRIGQTVLMTARK